jgi:hypothetical protein
VKSPAKEPGLGGAVWEITGPIPGDLQQAIVAHLRDNCSFRFEQPYRLTGEPAPHYGAALLCQLVLLPGCLLTNRRKKRTIDTPASFYFLFKRVNEDETLIPLTGGEGDILLANRWMGLSLQDDEQRLHYARFYCAFAQMKRPPQFHSIPRRLHELNFKTPVTEKQIWGVYGAMWRFLVDAKTLEIRPHFERRGVYWLRRHRAHLPMQVGNQLIDVDLKIWERDGHVSFRTTSLIYADDALSDEPQARTGGIGRPRYIRRGEWLYALYQNFKTRINQGLYLAAFALFLASSAIGLALPLEILGIPFGRVLPELMASITGLGDWTTWLNAACLYCIASFVLTTLLILDVETLRDSLLTWFPRLERTRLAETLHAIIVRRHRLENGYRRGLMRRAWAAASWLVVWTIYLVCVFTSLQSSYRPRLADDARTLADVMQVFAEQAALYIPVVFYYVGRKSLDPTRVALVSLWILIAFQLIMGLLVIRRIHRFWASTAASRLATDTAIR